MKEEYRNLIMELLDALDGEALKSIYSFILGLMDAKKRRCGMSEKRREEKNRLIDAINEILHSIDSIWILEQVYRCAKNITK